MTQNLIDQLNTEKHRVDFNTFDITVKELINMVNESYIDIAPEYQRQFRWDDVRQSKLVESVFLGIPIPSLFMATNSDGSWELIDGVQRLSTLIRFAGDESVRERVGLKTTLRLSKLEKLDLFNGKRFENLPRQVQLQLELKPIKVTTLSDKSDVEVRFDLFERLNPGGIRLTDQEIRSCILRGNFNDFIKRLMVIPVFRDVAKIPDKKKNDGTAEEWILRFFAYLNDRENFKHSVSDFLTNYMEKASDDFSYQIQENIFVETFTQLSQALEDGIHRNGRKSSPTVLYEAVTVGAAEAIKTNGQLVTNDIENWMNSEELKELTTGATNSKPKVEARIEFCKQKFLGN